MRKKLFLRIENLLWLVPAVAGYIFAIFLPEKYCDVLIFGSHFLISHFEATFYWIVILLFPYIMHYALRMRNKGNEVVAIVHIVLTLGIILAFPFVYSSAPLILDQWHHLTLPPPMYDKWQSISYAANIMWSVLVTVQLAFFIYGFIVLFSKEKE